MKIEQIKQKLEQTESLPVGVKNKYSVLIPLIEVDGEACLLYEVRSFDLRSQPGEISFPGGKIENGETSVQAALRETSEELLIEENQIEILGEGDFLVNPYHSIIYSSIGQLKVELNEIKPSADEVDSIFCVPISYFMQNEPNIYELDLNVKSSEDFPYELIPNGVNYKFKRGRDEVHFYKYEDKIIWGFTAKITYEFIKKLKNNY